jgi:hypothetical protein
VITSSTRAILFGKKKVSGAETWLNMAGEIWGLNTWALLATATVKSCIILLTLPARLLTYMTNITENIRGIDLTLTP